MNRTPSTSPTFFVTTVTASRRPLFHLESNARLMLDILEHNRSMRKYELHAFVLMPDHLHLLLTPSTGTSLERAMQLIKAGFSFRMQTKLPIWQRTFDERQIQGHEDHLEHTSYIVNNPVRSRLSAHPSAYPYSSASLSAMCDAAPKHLF